MKQLWNSNIVLVERVRFVLNNIYESNKYVDKIESLFTLIKNIQISKNYFYLVKK